MSINELLKHNLIMLFNNFVNSMKVANVLRVSNSIKHLFKDYEDLRAYWKNMVKIFHLLYHLKLIFPKIINYIKILFSYLYFLFAEIKISNVSKLIETL